MSNAKKTNPWRKRVLLGILILALGGAGVAYYIFTEKFSDTAEAKADFTVNAADLIAEFRKDNTAASKKYAEKIMVVNGTVSETEMADTTVNIKFADTLTGSYAIFAFQKQHSPEVKSVKEGDKLSVKGSCSGGVYSQILEANIISFKRCAINFSK